MKKFIAKVKALFTKKETPVIAPEQMTEDIWVPSPIVEQPKPTPVKPKSNRKPGPKKEVPGKVAVKSNAAPAKKSGPSKPRTYNKQKPKKVD